VRNIRSKMNIPERKPLDVVVSLADVSTQATIAGNEELLKRLGYLQTLTVGVNVPKPPSSAADVVGTMQVFVPLAGIINFDVERQKVQKQIDGAEKQLASLRARLAKPEFVEKAPKEVVDREREREKELSVQIDNLKQHLAELA